MKRYFETDQLCFRESENAENTYKVNLALLQKEKSEKVFQILEKEFGIKMKVWDTIPMEDQDKSIRNLNPILD